MKKLLLFVPPLFALICAAGLFLRPAVTPPPAQTVIALREERPPDEPARASLPSQPLGPEAPLDLADWRLALVNPWNLLPVDYAPELTQLRNGQSVDERCYPDLQEMMDDCRAAGLEPLICSSYRTWERQEELFSRKVSQFAAQGLSEEEARAEAARVVALPGASEHQLGLAVDIVDMDYQLLDGQQAQTPVQRWLLEHCWEYGFILRYPADKEALTGIIHEPWHYRYVGRDNARAIYDSGLCLEEYLGQAAPSEER